MISQCCFRRNQPILFYSILFCRGEGPGSKICCTAHPDAPLIEDYRAGDQICSECGLVVGDRFVAINIFLTPGV